MFGIYALRKSKISWFFRFISFFILVGSAPLLSESVEKTDLRVSHAIIQKPFEGAKSASGYLVIENKGKKEVFLTSASISLGTAMIHKTLMDDDGIIRMQHLPEIIIPGNKSVHFKPGDLHIMIIGLKRTLQAEEKIPAHLHFRTLHGKDFEIDIVFKVGEEQGETHSHAKGKHKH